VSASNFHSDPQIDRYAVIGNPIAHSKSPDIHARFAAQTGQHLSYERLLAPLDGFAAVVRTFIQEGGKGMNVTVPFKLEAYALADTLTARAQAAGAVNTLQFKDGSILGDNTDGVGLVHDIVRNAGVSIVGKSVLLLGAGGAARGVILPLLEQQPRRLVLANRTVSKAEDLARQFSAQGAIDVCAFDAVHEAFDIVINATAASLSAELPPISPAVFGTQTLAYDMMYGKDATVFMQFAAANSARTRDGLGMLVEQAAESFYLWRGVRPETDEVFAALRKQLHSQT
jgi:shikimate dehydrogenase